MPKYQTIVIEYDDEQPPFRSFGQKVAGMQIVSMSLNNALEENTQLEAKVEQLEEQIKEWEYDNG
ncbi:hypothetical protein A8139_05665 [Marinomonas primoryensis]|uniref:Uncharacterized protein n=1 Tax=Marinomonas primoryensis TaxID=178399 RepID=A0A2Z4PQW1_9GAMM|nr:hypothetical protein [Marinomonas primoryensis]AWX99538.1 hypothetical protein A8139_05665 [Marinomonas primoryensis]